MCLPVWGNADAGMLKSLFHDLGMNALRDEQGRTRVAAVVKVNLENVQGGDPLLKPSGKDIGV